MNSLKDFKNKFISNDAIELTKIDKKPIVKGKFIFEKNVIEQLDILYFPETTSNYKYILVCIDVGTNHVDAEPMKLRDSNTTLQAYKIILKRKNIKLPILIMTDGGNEFKGIFSKYLKEHNIAHQITTRHRQLTPVDRICALLGKYLNQVMLTEEIKTNKVNVNSWKKYLSTLIKILNKQKYIKPSINIDDLNPNPLGDGEILKIDDRVRILLEKPIDYITGNKLYGKFRASDIRFSKEIYKIYQICINPQQPVTYILVDKDNHVLKHIAFHENELKLVNTTF
jgi:hypothetical protein